MPDWPTEYTETDDLSEKYDLLRTEITRLRGQRDKIEFFDEEAVVSDIRQLNQSVDGDLLVFLANDFGRPRAYRPSTVEQDVQNDVRKALLQNKYDETNEDLNKIRQKLLDEHPNIHKAIVVEYSEEDIRYHLPEGSNQSTNFVTVREMVGLIDYTTNSFQNNGLSVTY